MRTVRDVMRGDIEVLRTTETAADAACYLAAHREDSVPAVPGRRQPGRDGEQPRHRGPGGRPRARSA